MTRLVVHADDVGMCHGANQAFQQLSAFGTITSGSVMVPCPWFSELAAMATDDPRLDVGVHLTLNSEHQFYRWGPVSDADQSTGLVDSLGYFWPDVATLRQRAKPDAVEAEWRAQLDLATASGIDVTHVDAHMGSALAPEWAERYLQVALDYDVIPLIINELAVYGPNNHLNGVTETQFAPVVQAARAAGLPLFDRVLETDFGRDPISPPDYPEMLGDLRDPLVFCAFHPCAPGPGEIEVVEPQSCHVRTDEYALFGSDHWKMWLESQDFTLTTMRRLRDEWRAAHSR